MRRIVGSVFQSLDGVMQAPGAPAEDPTGGFELGGWAAGFFDEAVGAAIGALFAQPFALLLGRRTYDIFAAHWPYADDDGSGLAPAINGADKHVLTRSSTPLDWAGSHRVPDVEAVAALKAQDGPDLLIQGSSTIYPALIAHGLLDRLTTLSFPVVLGRGKRIFDGAPPTSLRLVEHRVSPRGVVIGTYEPAGPVTTGSFALAETSPREMERRRRMAAGDW